MDVNRRSLLVGVGASLITAPAIVRAASLMPVKRLIPIGERLADFERKQLELSNNHSWPMCRDKLYPQLADLKYANNYEVSDFELAPKIMAPFFIFICGLSCTVSGIFLQIRARSLVGLFLGGFLVIAGPLGSAAGMWLWALRML